MASVNAPEAVQDLVDRFERNVDAYRSGHYNETQVRLEFIDPLFEALGWDVYNKKGGAEAYKDVIHEDAIKVGGATKAPDYCFRIGGTRKFFLEAKKPSVSIKDEPSPAFQLRRYAWSAKLPLSILTDFEEFAAYDCRIKPAKVDKPSTARTLYIQYQQYGTRWDEIAAIFSRDAVFQGSFDKYAESTKRKRGTAEVDAAFLKDIEAWRDMLARNIALRNPGLSQRELNFAVQRTIDRIIFLRICEDRHIESYGQLMALLNGSHVYERLAKAFRDADDRYNSGLFYFRREKGRKDAPDELSLGLSIDDKPLKDIIKTLYYPESPYEFSVLPADILGQVYEQFLGKVIRLTAGHRAVVEDKPEVKKAGGVYYTPTYIVDYIVKHTVGKLVEGKRPGPRGGVSKLRILDPACGSGSFLIGAYQYLLDWHRDRYVEDGPDKWTSGAKPALYQASGGHWRLTTGERRRILLNNIYGVDIDPQAVEVTKLSLLLKVLEGESEQTLAAQLRLFHERALPDLANNIKCGNSLIGPDFYQGRQMSLLDDEERYRVNVFDWHAEFPEVFNRQDAKDAKGEAGFDAVIGNPPYGTPLSGPIREYLTGKHPYVSDFETSQYFLGKAHTLARNKGYVSFIVPNTVFLNVLAQRFRKFIAASFGIVSLANLAAVDVFQTATVRTAIPVLIQGGSSSMVIEFVAFENESSSKSMGRLAQHGLADDDRIWIAGLSGSSCSGVKEKMLEHSVPLGEILEVSQGLIPYDKYRGHDEHTIKNRIWHADTRKDSTYRRELRGADVRRYSVAWNGKRWISYGPWLAAPRKPEFFTEPRLLFREITDPKSGLLHVGYTEQELYNNPSIINCISRGTPYSLLYVLGLGNSRLMAYLHFSSSPKARKGVFPKILVSDVRNLPIRAIGSDSGEGVRQEELVERAGRMLSLHKHLAAAKTGHDKTAIQRQIDATDRQIDRLVYELYELTEEEITIVEEAAQ